jgi:hypothetical protein
MNDRERIAADQARLLAALVDDAQAPVSFDAQRLAVAAASLRRKRERTRVAMALDHLRQRRFGVALLRVQRRLILALRLPGLGVRVLRLG